MSEKERDQERHNVRETERKSETFLQEDLHGTSEGNNQTVDAVVSLRLSASAFSRSAMSLWALLFRCLISLNMASTSLIFSSRSPRSCSTSVLFSVV